MTTQAIKQKHALPLPGPEALALSRVLQKKIIDAIHAHDNKLPFADFMQLALYEPKLGYYQNALTKFGRDGDFTTAPETSALFGASLAQYCQKCFAKLNKPSILEFGAGSGKLCIDILTQLQRDNNLPEHYYIIELSAPLRARQQHTIKQALPTELAARVVHLDKLPADNTLEAVIIANEVLDAMPVVVFDILDNTIQQCNVSLAQQQLTWTHSEVTDSALLTQLQALQQRHQITSMRSEINPWLTPWIKSLYAMLTQGQVLLIDYGYGEAEYYRADRTMGTLSCHYQHHAHDNPLWYPGLQDITAKVDFTAVAQAALDAGFDITGYSSQAMFLLGNQITELLQQQMSNDETANHQLNQQLKTLTYPNGMGELFKVIALSKSCDLPMLDFSMRDMRDRL